MGTIKEEAEAYEPKETKTIAELPHVSVNFVTEDDEYDVEEDGKTKKVQQKIIKINGETYRVPNMVLKQLKAHLEENPNIKFFKVNKKGVGLKTNYVVIPILETPVGVY